MVTLVEALRYAAGPGVSAVVGAVLSFVVEMLPGTYGSLSALAKRWVMLVLCLVVPVSATIGLWAVEGWPVGWQAMIDSLWPALVAGATAFASATLVHSRKLKI